MVDLWINGIIGLFSMGFLSFLCTQWIPSLQNLEVDSGPAQLVDFCQRLSCRMGSGVALVEEASAHVDSFLHYFLLELVEWLIEASVDDGLTTWRQLPVYWTTAHPPKTPSRTFV